MIRFRVGQSWKRDRGPRGEPRDAFAFEIDGVNLVPGAHDEPLKRVVRGLLEGVAALVAGGERAAQLSLDDVLLEVCFWRRPGLEVEVTVISLGQPPRRVRPTVVVELPALVDAAVRCGRGLLADLEGGPGALAIARRVRALQSTVVAPLEARPARPWRASRVQGTLGYTLEDPEGRALATGRKARAGLAALLVEGSVVAAPGAAPVKGPPFLTLLGLARAAGEGSVRLGGAALEPKEVFSAGLDLCLELRTRNPALTANPWLEALQVRCAEGLQALRAPVPARQAEAAPTPAAPRPSPPLSPTGSLRRLSLKARWSRPVALGEEGGRLHLAGGQVVVASAHAAHGFSRLGETLFRRLAARGVATLGLATLCATPDQLLFFEGPGPSASWMRDHDGATVGPLLLRLEGLLVTALARRGAAGLEPDTGRERWRFDPPRTQRAWVAVAGPRLLITTDGGTLHGLDAGTGQLRFSVRSSMPGVGPAVRAGSRAVVLLRRAEQAVVFCCEALARGERSPAGAIAWTRELELSAPTTPVVARGRVYLTGQRGGQAVAVALSGRGQPLWERPLPLDAHGQVALPFEGGLVVTDARGGAVRLLPDGQPAWVLGGGSDQLARPVPPALRRGVLVVPGPTVRLVDPASGRLLAQLETGPHVSDVQVDPRFGLYVLHEPGLLEAFEPAAVLALVR